jgi:hypothetical protein
MSRHYPTFLLAILACFPSLAQAAKVKVWHHCTPSHHEKARFKGAVVSNEGALRLSRQLKPLARLDAAHVWDLVEDQSGNLYVATGDEGRIFKVSPGGQATLVYESEDSEVLCLALAPDGSIYAGTGPNGHLLRIAPDGQTKVLHKSPESYIWCLALDASGETIYAGTGPKGRIYQVTPQGKATVFYTTKQDHVLCLAMGPDGVLYAGTDKNGLIYRLDGKGKGFVVYHAPQTEVRRLLVGPDGIYAGTSAPRHGGRGNMALRSNSSSDRAVTLTSATKTIGRTVASESGPGKPASAASGAKDKDEKSSSAPAPLPPSSGENSLYRIGSDGTVREVFREKVMILSMLRQNGRIFIGTGTDGQLFEVDETTKERFEVARLDHGQIHCLCRRRDGSIVLGAGDPGKLYVLQDKYTQTGTIVSDVLDAKMSSKWGSLRWKATIPAGTQITVAVRSGNLPEPDETWSNWSAEQTDADTATMAAPAARYLQYRVTLTTNNPLVSPSLQSLALRYSTVNQAPEVTAVEVPDLDAVNLENPKKLKFKWTATDPNEDDLTYNLYIRKDGWTHWVLLEEGWDKREYDWDTTTTPSGMYQLKVVASDRKDNAPEDALTGERVSTPFAVTHTPPVVKVKVTEMDGEHALLEATATDALVRLTAASYAVNGKKWINVFPADGLFDSKAATFRFRAKVAKPGTYVVVLRVHDAAGNIGSGDVVFTVPAGAAKK